MKSVSKTGTKPGLIRAGMDSPAGQRSNSASASVMSPAVALPRPKAAPKAR